MFYNLSRGHSKSRLVSSSYHLNNKMSVSAVQLKTEKVKFPPDWPLLFSQIPTTFSVHKHNPAHTQRWGHHDHQFEKLSIILPYYQSCQYCNYLCTVLHKASTCTFILHHENYLLFFTVKVLLFKKYFQKAVMNTGAQSRRAKMCTNSKNTLTSNLYLFRTSSWINF